MRDLISRRAVLAGLLATAATPALSNPPKASLRPALRGGEPAVIPGPEEIVAKARLEPGRVSYMVADAGSGLLLEGRNAQAGIPPASVAKALTALYALDVLGPAHRFETQVLITGGMRDGIVLGDLVLVGGGDPTLDTTALAQMAKDLKSAGVREVRGRFRVYDGALPFERVIDADQPDHVGYNPALSGIALNYNRVHFQWQREAKGYSVTMDARSDRFRPDVAMARMRVEDRSTPVYTYADAGVRDDWTVAKGALGKTGARWLPVRKPALYAGEVFATLARSHGIGLRGIEVISELPEGDIVVRHQSDDLRTILKDMLRYSTNITAEMVGLTASARRLGGVGSIVASADAMNRWARETLGLEAPSMVDHSGLGDASRISATDMVRALVMAYDDAVLRPILKDVVMRDGRGRPDNKHPIRVAAKTGTLNFVSGLAGYMTAGDGTVLAFAIFAADEATRATIPRAQRERPPGARGWNRRAKTLQQDLIERWGALYGT
ncbi:D-alanyl-D-alanine carboxypeptidase/D-alanyl-D-alanine endopeptidase [Sulfitobacter sabulilitoris]|uniref:D-alanyl-D-alanine carboxypeptidase/D-alanyl-D-alanine-endopeptidase n=1 Tax=Sulfitobacter sabulilitoris TaxID=2562655 RepID=A0A5S3PDX7_9RHOB|nr:D-alanyl-D-alanine carboxypeptidase/D-alanyl-D-alanine-endopeptidase [Sulfitobacter sabulilitoris]TMM51159.1 D-alanyl-D-alanine carboxypeptidase/D-alanyl-D-alanine-endopeptidase [Sulfitobacter sabulilitoris]